MCVCFLRREVAVSLSRPDAVTRWVSPDWKLRQDRFAVGFSSAFIPWRTYERGCQITERLDIVPNQQENVLGPSLGDKYFEIFRGKNAKLTGEWERPRVKGLPGPFFLRSAHPTKEGLFLSRLRVSSGRCDCGLPQSDGMELIL